MGVEFQEFPSFVTVSLVAKRFGLAPNQLMDRVRHYNRRHPREPIRRAHGLLCVDDLTLLFPQADPHIDLRRRMAKEDALANLKNRSRSR